jgi:putative membrane protein
MLGVLAGIIAGLIPGLHSNNIAVIVATSPLFGIEIVTFMLSMSITQCFVEFIPSTFLGAPSESTFESVLPAHRMLLEGEALQAICLTTFGALIAVITGAILTPLFFIFLEQNSEQIILATPWVLGFALIAMTLSESGIKKKTIVIFTIIAAASQGFLFKDQLFPLITGYFGIAGTIYSLKEKPVTIKQKTESNFETNPIDGFIGLVGGAIVSIMPGIGSNTAAAIINFFKKTTDTKKYLTMLGAINTSNFFFSYTMLFALSKTRNGAMLALQDKIFFTPQMLTVGTAIMIASAGIGALATIILAKKAIHLFDQNKTRLFSIASIILMVLLVGLLNGTNGLITLIFSTALGLFVIMNGVRRSTCMAALIVPVLFFYLFILF